MFCFLHTLTVSYTMLQILFWSCMLSLSTRRCSVLQAIHMTETHMLSSSVMACIKLLVTRSISAMPVSSNHTRGLLYKIYGG